MDTTKSPLGPSDQLLKPISTLDGQHLPTFYGLMRTVHRILVIPESVQIPFCVDIYMSFNRAHFTMFLGIALVFIITAEICARSRGCAAAEVAQVLLADGVSLP